MYTNTRNSSYVKDGMLHIKPFPTADWLGEDVVKAGKLDLGDECTDARDNGCYRDGTDGHYVNPICSARLMTKDTFSFTYGRVEINATLPKGDWMHSALWLMPNDSKYGDWPTSGEIDLMEARGNDPVECPSGGTNKFASTLHWGPEKGHPDAWQMTNKKYIEEDGDFSKGFHVYQLDWTPSGV